MKIAFLFAGQGAQYPEMGKQLYDAYPQAKAVFDEISTIIDVKQLCFHTSKEELQDTRNAQPAIFAHSMAAAAVLSSYGIEANVCAGLSLGEYSALCYAKSFSIKDGASILCQRANLMAQSLQEGATAMYAILMLEKEKVLQACKEVSHFGVCEIANYNCPGQIVITGEKQAVEEGAKHCLELGARRVLPLAVSGAFHSSLLKPQASELVKVLTNFSLKTPSIPVYHNLTGTCESGDLVDILSKQLCSSVQFEKTIMQMLADGVDTFIEIGPGNTLSGFVKKCAKKQAVIILHVEDVESLQACVEAVKGK